MRRRRPSSGRTRWPCSWSARAPSSRASPSTPRTPPRSCSVCSHVDGIPLALELAAVRLGALGLDGLDRGLAARLGALGTGDRSASPRQQTLEGAIDWSYQLLSEHERLLWARLSVFAGGFELDAARSVCAGDGLDADDIPGLVGSLVEQSVVKRRRGTPVDRFRLLEPLRQFGRERLREAGEEHDAALAPSGLGRRSCARSGRRGRAPGRAVPSGSATERANVWAAIEFCLADPAEAEAGATICSDLWVYWVAQGPVNDIRRVLAVLLPSIPEATRSRARALYTAGSLAFVQNDYSLARRMFDDAVAIGRAMGDADIVARSLAFLSSVSWVESKRVDAVAFGDEAARPCAVHAPSRCDAPGLTSRGYARLAIRN